MQCEADGVPRYSTQIKVSGTLPYPTLLYNVIFGKALCKDKDLALETPEALGTLNRASLLRKVREDKRSENPNPL